MSEHELRHFLHTPEFLAQGPVFGRRIHDVAELLPFIPRVLQYLRRCHHNRTKRQYKDALVMVDDVVTLLHIIREWEMAGYSDAAMKLTYERGAELGLDITRIVEYK
ncbi:hypothetical protein DFH09DRAFT_1308923 [Mycena vulgaris]|nr:hypothetical protein DFH09DRAFT_1308923 [Mycena vulgaris]